MISNLGRAQGVLSDEDIKREIQATPSLLQNVPPSEPLPTGNFQPAAYDLRVGHIITPNDYVDMNTADKIVRLRQGGMATLASWESLNIPSNMTGLIIPRNEPAQRGLLISNAGHVDPGHVDFVMAQVINLTEREFPLEIGASYFSIVFQYLETPTPNPRERNEDRERRLQRLRLNASQLPVSLVQIQADILERTFVSHRQINIQRINNILQWITVLNTIRRGLAILLAVAIPSAAAVVGSLWAAGVIFK